MPFQKATKRQARLRMALVGPSGSGKTMTALKIASGLSGKIALVDTERGSASKYADKFGFDVLELESFHPQRYIDAIHEAEAAGYEVLIIDSLSHAWTGKEGALELVDRAAKRSQSGNSFGAWREVTPLHNALVDAMLGCKCHVITTMRAKTDYSQEKDDRGRTVIRKVGLAPVQRDGLEYEFDLVGDLDQDNNLIITKSRCEALTGAIVNKAGAEVATTLRAWLTDGATPATPTQPTPQPTTAIVRNGQESYANGFGVFMDNIKHLDDDARTTAKAWAEKFRDATTADELKRLGQELGVQKATIHEAAHEPLKAYWVARQAKLAK